MSLIRKFQLVLSLTIAFSTISVAGDIHEFSAKDSQPEQIMNKVKNLGERPQINNQALVDGPQTQDFSWEEYLARTAPKLLQYKDALSHWSGIASLNPKVVIALMEYESNIITKLTAANLKQPFGDVSTKDTFAGQLEEVLLTLSNRFYTIIDLQKTDLAARKQTAATIALASMLTKNKPVGSKELNQFIQVYENLFPGQSKLLIARDDDSKVFNDLVPPNNMMQMPWREGYSWKPNGAHSTSGSGFPLSSIDFAYNWPRWGGQTYSVTAAHSGYVRVYSKCNVRVNNANGWSTNYYHMQNIEVSNGQWVNINTKLGVYASDKSTALCQGGSSTGPHLHFSLLYNGYYKSLQNVNLGPYVINVGNYSYDNNCSRYWLYQANSRTKYCAWSKIYNSGVYDQVG